MAFIEKKYNKKMCYIANLGDTRAVICTDKNIAKRVSIDHKVSNPS
jgi:serine/threonine protein phosphatase PrpC